MANRIFKTLLLSEIEKFRNNFSGTAKDLFYDEDKKRLIHSGEFGMFREKSVIPFLRMITPQRLSINTGFIITPKDNISTQCDIIIYDSQSTPLIQDDDRQTFYPVETVVSVGEIKSKLSRMEFIEAINKLARIKKLRADIDPNRVTTIKSTTPQKINLKSNPRDHIFSFMICEKLNFNYNKLNFDDLYDEDIDFEFRHNMILSVQDGLYFYYNNKTKTTWVLPSGSSGNFNKNQLDPNYFESPQKSEPNHHFLAFSHYFFLENECSNIFYPDIVHYIK